MPSSKWKLLPKSFYKYSNLKTFFDANHIQLSEELIPKFYTDIQTLYIMFYNKNPKIIAKIIDTSLWFKENI